MKWWDRIKYRPFFIRLFNWEYWSSITFYWPMFIYGPMLAIRSGHPCFFTAANPSIHTGGFGFESKISTIVKIPLRYRPGTILAPQKMDFAEVLRQMENADIQFPVIAKPDFGYRGFLVSKIEDETNLRAYLDKYPVDFIIQDFVDLPMEVGVLYYRFPNKKRGKVSSITLKEFLHVRGDGQLTVRELINQNPRAVLQIERLEATHAEVLDTVPDAGEKVSLGVIGNHVKGTAFIDGNHLIDRQLTSTFDKIAQEIEGFNYGRFDIKCNSLEDLKKGENLKILEINGVCSEPAHIYDPVKSSYFKALRGILKHWKIVRRISEANHQLGIPYMRTFDMLRLIRDRLGIRKYIRKNLIES